MNKRYSIVFGLLINLFFFQAEAKKLKLDYVRKINHEKKIYLDYVRKINHEKKINVRKINHEKKINDKSKDNDFSEDFPTELIPNVNKYLLVTSTPTKKFITFTSNKSQASNFEIEDIIKTTLGSSYYRITHQNDVLIWNKNNKQFILISKDEKLNPLKKQIQWLALLNWFNCKKDISPDDDRSIILTRE